MSSTVEIKNIKAIKHLSFDLPDDGAGVIVLTGFNGSGKTTAIAALESLLGTESNKLAPTRGAESGEVTGLGRRVRVGKKQTITGQTSVKILRGIDLSVIVDPKVDDPKARTKYRIRELVSLGGKKVDPSELLADGATYVDIDSAKTIDDPVQMADFLKRGLESAARERRRQAEVKSDLSKVRLLEAGDIDQLSEEVDVQSLADAHRQSIQASNDAKAAKLAYDNAIESNRKTEEKLAKLEASYSGPSDREKFLEQWSSIDSRIAEVQKQLADLFKEKNKMKNDFELIKSHDEAVEALEGSFVVTAGMVRPTVGEIADLEKIENESYQKLIDSGEVEKRRQALKHSKDLRNECVELSQEADKISELIGSVQAKVQELLPAGPLVIEDGTLIIDSSGEIVSFDELSEGQRWYVVLDYAIIAVGPGGVIPISQEAWQSFAPTLKQQVLEQCKAKGVVVITAEVDDGPLRAVEYE